MAASLQCICKRTNFGFICLMLLHVNPLAQAGTLGESFGQDLVQVSELKILIHCQIKQETSCEVSKGHKVANWLHDIPTVSLECTPKDESKLRNTDATSSPEEHLSLPLRTLLVLINFGLDFSHLHQKLFAAHERLPIVDISVSVLVIIFRGQIPKHSRHTVCNLFFAQLLFVLWEGIHECFGEVWQ